MQDSSSNMPESHPKVSFGKTGVLLINLGTPDGTGYCAMRRYLKEFLSDPRVIEVPRLIWWFILNIFILTFRPKKSGKAYEKIWLKKENESPLLFYTRSQAKKLQTALGKPVHVDFAMRYGNPSIESKLKSLKQAGCNRVLLYALYPQYSATTSATVYDECFRSIMKMRWQPAVRTVPTYHDHEVYVDSLAQSLRKHIESLSWEPDLIVASFHGLPKAYLEKGDPYHCFCQKTGRLLKEKLGFSDQNFKVCFQSRFGPQEWLQPYTDKTLESLPKEGVKKVVVITPGFVSDCVETLEEIDIQNRELFMESGGEEYSMVPCLNDSELGMRVIEDISRSELKSWL